MKLKDTTPFFILKTGLLITIAGALLTGCAVGPDFRSSKPPGTNAYTTDPLPAKTAEAAGIGGASQSFVSGQDISAQWWTLFHSEDLNRVINRALADSPTLAAAQAKLREAQENRRAQFGTLFPSVDANVSGARQQISSASYGPLNTDFSPYNLFNASVNVTYLLDVFGALRRQLEALEAQIDYQRFQLEGTYLTLTSNIVTTSVREASLRSQIRATEEILKVEKQNLDVVESQFQLGGVSRSEVLAQQTLLAQTKTTLPPLEKELSQTRHQLAVLTGRLPGEADLPEFNLSRLELPQELPVSLPSSLVRQRPDIAASEALLHAACAKVGVATANLFPQITLTGGYGSDALTVGSLFNSSTTYWGFGAGVLQHIFRGGELLARRRAAVAFYEQASAHYRETVLLAFQNVADVLRALEADARSLQARADAERIAGEALDLTQKQFQLGAVSYLSLLNAERQYHLARIRLIQGQAVRFADTAALFQALGGGWWNRPVVDDFTATPQQKD